MNREAADYDLDPEPPLGASKEALSFVQAVGPAVDALGHREDIVLVGPQVDAVAVPLPTSHVRTVGDARGDGVWVHNEVYTRLVRVEAVVGLARELNQAATPVAPAVSA